MSNTCTHPSNQQVTAAAVKLSPFKTPATTPKEYLYIPLWKVFLLSFTGIYIYLWIARNWNIYQVRHPKPYSTRFGRWFWRQRRTALFMLTGAGLIKDFMPEDKQSLWRAVGLIIMILAVLGLLAHFEFTHISPKNVAICFIAARVATALFYTKLQRIINRSAKRSGQKIQFLLQTWNKRAITGLLCGLLIITPTAFVGHSAGMRLGASFRELMQVREYYAAHNKETSAQTQALIAKILQTENNKIPTNYSQAVHAKTKNHVAKHKTSKH